ncbi:MAG: hypothetical protein ACTSUE_08730 [Promethearchaeota archaeon]
MKAGYLKKPHEISSFIENFLTNPRTVKISLISAICTFLPAILIGYIVAGFDPDGYNMVDNYISDMGSVDHTPCVLFLDFGAMITAFLLIPSIFYMEKTFAPIGEQEHGYKAITRWRVRLATFGGFALMLSMIGLFGIGLFSEDRSNMLKDSLGLKHMHGFFSYIVFGGLVLSSIIMGILFIFYKLSSIPRIIGFSLGTWMVFGPITMALFFLSHVGIGIDQVPPSAPFWEWMLLFSIFVWLIPTGSFIIHETSGIIKASNKIER